MRRVNSWFLRIGGLFIGVFMLLYVLPLALTLVYSLVQRPNNLVFVGADNYLAVLGNRYFRLAFSYTLVFLVYAIPLTLLSCLAAAYLLDRIGLIMLLPFMVLLWLSQCFCPPPRSRLFLSSSSIPFRGCFAASSLLKACRCYRLLFSISGSIWVFLHCLLSQGSGCFLPPSSRQR